MNILLNAIENEQKKSDVPSFKVGDSVRVHTKVVEGDKERVQLFTGIVIGRKGTAHRHLHDSKKLSATRRASIYRELTTDPAVSWACAALEPAEIDRLNILRATHEAMRRALLALPVRPDHAFIDGLPVEPFPVPHTALVEGDAISLSIAAASVVAKVTRDRIMEEWDTRFPAYGFSKHKGYSTSQHLAILARDGPCPIHRYSFRPVAEPHLAFAAYGTASAAGLARRKGSGEVPSAERLQGALPPLPAAGPQGRD